MRKGTLLSILWAGTIAAFALVLIMPASRDVFLAATKAHPYAMGFAKFAVLATMGELLAIRIRAGNWATPSGLHWRALIWGLIGMLIALIFQVFSNGVGAAMGSGLLPHSDNPILIAILVSSIMNLTFAPTFMAAHRITDTWLDLWYEKRRNIRVMDVTTRIDWDGFVSFVVLKTIPLFWIPAHTITFMLPPEYRVIAAAFLSIALGGILSFAKRREKINLEAAK
jgi:hypothetical protein